jgi:hypothetical protein
MLKQHGFATSDILYPKGAVVAEFLSSGHRHFVLSVTGTIAKQYPHQFANTSGQYYPLHHGVDDWGFFAWTYGVVESIKQRKLHELRDELPSLSYSKYLHQYCYKDPMLMLKRGKPHLPTVLYAPTYGLKAHRGPCMDSAFLCHFRDCKRRTKSAVVEGLIKLTKDHNVILRLHPYCFLTCFQSVASLQRLLPGVIIDDPANWFHPFDVAKHVDLFIGEGGAVTAAVVAHLKTPVMFLLSNRDRYLCVREKTINESMAEIFFPFQERGAAAFLKAVARAKAKVWSASQEQVRRDYAKRWTGEIDGYEEYLVVAKLLRLWTHDDQTMAREVAVLENLLAKFSKASRSFESTWSLRRPCELPCCSQCLGGCCPTSTPKQR